MGATEAAEHYRVASELKRKAREQLVSAIVRERSAVNLRGVSRTAGLNESTLYKWIEREASSNGRAQTPS